MRKRFWKQVKPFTLTSSSLGALSIMTKKEKIKRKMDEATINIEYLEFTRIANTI